MAEKRESRGNALVSLIYAYDLDDVAGALGLGPDDEITDDQLREFAHDDAGHARLGEWEVKR